MLDNGRRSKKWEKLEEGISSSEEENKGKTREIVREFWKEKGRKRDKDK